MCITLVTAIIALSAQKILKIRSLILRMTKSQAVYIVQDFLVGVHDFQTFAKKSSILIGRLPYPNELLPVSDLDMLIEDSLLIVSNVYKQVLDIITDLEIRKSIIATSIPSGEFNKYICNYIKVILLFHLPW